MGRFEKLKYINHLGETLKFGQAGLFVDVNDLRNYAWEVNARGSKITGFGRGITQKTLPVGVGFQNAAYVTDLKNKLFEFAEKDVIAKKYGRIIIGDYYFKCYVTASAKAAYIHDPCFTQFNIELTTDEPYWIKEQTFSLYPAEVNTSVQLDYAYDFPYDYSKASGSQYIESDFFADSNFRMIVYGAADNPAIFINGHMYKVNVTVAANEYLTIDSIAKTIVLTRNDGTKVNVFDNRERSSYIFEPIPSGNNAVTWTGDFGIDITLIEERSEPKWT